MKKNTLYIITALAVILFASSCDQTRRGSIEGTIAEAEGRLLYLEHLTDGTPRMVDTIRLDKTGKFKFAPEVENGPDFFSLHLDNNQSCPIVIDTLLTPVVVTATASKLANGYEVTDDANKLLKEAALLGNQFRSQYIAAFEQVRKGSLPVDTLSALVAGYKDAVYNRILSKDMVGLSSPAAYYVLHETLGGRKIFDPTQADDNRRFFGPVTNVWKSVYGNSPRIKALEQKTLEGMQLLRSRKVQAAQSDSILQSKMTQLGFPELNLRNADDHHVALSSLVDGKSVVVVDFTAYAFNVSPAHNLVLGGIYEKYAGKGLKIYQVCLDFNENFWKTSADNLPWTTVRDEEVQFDVYGNIQYSPAAALYNVQSMPVSYLIDKNGEVKVRVEDDTKLEAEILKLIK